MSFSNAAGNSSDWIGLYEAGDANDQDIAWRPTGGVENGSVNFSGLSSAGNYESRLFFYDSYTVEATAGFTVE